MIFHHLLTLTIAETYTPLEWEGYVPYLEMWRDTWK
jgi:hypothetical protein